MHSVISKGICDEVRDKRGKEAATALLSALEATVSMTPQCLIKIVGVLEGCTVTESAASKMRRKLSNAFSTRRIATSASSNPGRFIT